MPIVVRRAGSEDWAELRRIRLEALTVAPLAFASTLAREVDFSEATWRSRAESSAVFLATDGERAVGTATGFHDPGRPPGTVVLVAMYVAPAARGTGCAARLVSAVASAARADGADRLRLEVVESNVTARGLYRRCGFTATGSRRPLPHAPHLSELEMVLPLSEQGAADRPDATGVDAVTPENVGPAR